jgi:hypothetical protein
MSQRINTEIDEIIEKLNTLKGIVLENCNISSSAAIATSAQDKKPRFRVKTVSKEELALENLNKNIITIDNSVVRPETKPETKTFTNDINKKSRFKVTKITNEKKGGKTKKNKRTNKKSKNRN